MDIDDALGARTGFCGETEEEHAATLDLVQQTHFDQAFMFAYSERSKTFASRHLAVRVRQLFRDIFAGESI